MPSLLSGQRPPSAPPRGQMSGISGRCGKLRKGHLPSEQELPLPRKLPAPALGAGLTNQGSQTRGLPGQAGPGPRPQGLLIFLKLRPETRVGLGHGAGALHGLQTTGLSSWLRSAPCKVPKCPRRPRACPRGVPRPCLEPRPLGDACTPPGRPAPPARKARPPGRPEPG